MMFAQRVELDVAQQHDLIIALAKHRLEMPPRIILQSGHQLGVSASDAIGRLEQSLAVGILADRQEDVAHGFLDAREIDFGVAEIGSIGSIA